ncbi:M28 family peptidase [Helicobacter sp. 23-1044]
MGKHLQKILEIFYKICEIQHPSGQTQNLAKFIIDFLTKCDCKIQTDSAGNIHALKGKPHIIFQAHYDMVLVGDKIAPFVENGFLKSRDSSLGADNGIAVALLLHFAKMRTNIEILLTNDEEIGMIGANNIALKTHSKTMINLDSECVNEICVGCAGGFDADISFGVFMRKSVPFSSLRGQPTFCHSERSEESQKNIRDFSLHTSRFAQNDNVECAFYELTAQNFRGGHSGIDIDKNIPNAIVELLWGLESLREMGEFEIVEISGGEARNAIPINARAVISIKQNPCEAPKSRPLRGAKNREQTSSSASADFLLEAEKRGTPPKSEKAAAFWEHNLNEVGGSGSEVQPFLRKETSESNLKNGDFITESNLNCHFERSEKSQNNRDSSLTSFAQNDNLEADSANRAKNAESNAISQNLKTDSSLRTSRFAQNDESSVDCFDLQREFRNDESTPQIAIKKLKSYNFDSPQNPLPSTIIPHLLRLHNGIYEMSAQGVTSSLNFSLISDECLKIMVRANSDEQLHRHKSRLKSLFGENVAFSGFYSAWERESNEDSPILAQLQTLYKKHKIAHKIVQIHAGLECGILKQKCALHEVISIGPTILHPHSKSEALDLDSVCQIYDILCDLIPK